MALKKSELYSSLWSSCDELRGRMDPSQYKDYVLVLLFVKYISDKFAGQKYAPITIPKGASFADLVALKGKSDIGDQINKKILGPLAVANSLSEMPDFDDANKLGTGKEKVELLTNLICIFENPALDFYKNRADGEDLLGAGRQAAAELKDKGLIVYTVGYGSAMGSKITVSEGGKESFLRDQGGDEVISRMDPESLRAVAEVTGGEFLRADAMALPLLQLHDKRLVPRQKRSYDAGQETGKQARYQWVLLPLLLLLLWEIAMAGGRHR